MIKEFCLNPKKTGAVCPIGKQSIKNAFKDCSREHYTAILEIGGGTGNITSYVGGHLSPNTAFTIIEIQESFYHLLQESFGNKYTIIHNDFLYHDFQNNTFDLIYSTIPLSLLPIETQYAIVEKAYHLLSTGGTYIHIQYSHRKAKVIGEVFGDVSYTYCLYDFPFTCALQAQKTL